MNWFWLLLGFILTGIVFWHSKREIKKLTTDRDALSAENKALEERVSTLTTERNKLRKNVKNLRDANASRVQKMLEADIKVLEDKNGDLTTRLGTLRQNYESLLAERNSLSQRLNALVAKQARCEVLSNLQARREQRSTTFLLRQKDQEIERLLNEVEQLREELAEFKRREKEYATILDELREERKKHPTLYAALDKKADELVRVLRVEVEALKAELSS